MARAPRFVPPGALVEVTTRTFQGRFLLRPGRDLNEILLGVLARAAQRYGVKICAFVFLSNHAHLLLLPEDAGELAGFMRYLNGNVAKEAGRTHAWKGRVWSRRYRCIVVSNEEEAQVGRMRYLLANCCKENLVTTPQDWPGASSTDALLSGRALRGVWFDRTAEFEARRRRECFEKYTYSEVLEFELTPIPVWQHLDPSALRRSVAALVREISLETRARLRKAGKTPLGTRRIRRLDPHTAPDRPSRSPAPRFHAYGRSERTRLELAFQQFVATYRAATKAFRDGVLDVQFPPGCFKPSLPFERAGPRLWPA